MIMAQQIVRDTALSKSLQTIPISQIKLGMIIHAIGSQSGSLGVKHKGEVKHLNVIPQLKKNGVKTVVVEQPSDSFLYKTARKIGFFQHFANSLTFTKAINQTNIDIFESEGFSAEYATAYKLISKSESIFNDIKKDIASETPVSIKAVDELAKAIYQSQSKDPNALLGVSMIMDANTYQANHAFHCANLMCHFARHLGMSERECIQLSVLGYVFDLGMLTIDKKILQKTHALTKSETELIKKHVNVTLDLVRHLKLDSELLLAIEQHHERLDGSGYPAGVNGSDIQKYSRMLAIVDAYDAMTSQRSFQTPVVPQRALSLIMEENSGFDSKLAKQFLHSIGLYPVGSLVILSCNKVGIVTSINKHSLRNPTVQIFYDAKKRHFIEPKAIDLSNINNLAAKDNAISIQKSVLACEYGITPNQIFGV